jgi:hypothetical protein
MRDVFKMLSVLYALILLLPAVALAATENEEKTLDEIAKALSNPVAAISYVGNDFQYRSYQGDL